MKQFWSLSLVLGLTFSSAVIAQPLDPQPAQPPPKEGSIVAAGQPAGGIDVSLLNEVKAAIDRSLEWLASNQKNDGSWSDSNFPALTALATRAFIEGDHPRKKEVVDKAVKYILSCVQKDGGIYKNVEGRKGGGLSNYNTAICMMTLHATKDPAHAPVVLAARQFIADAQHFGDDEYRGGFGYDKKTNRAYTDLLNTYYVSVAMKETADVEDKRDATQKKVDINWAETVKYIEKLQNKPEAGKEQAGGFFYKPGESKAGAITNEAGVVVFRSFGSITYAGMLALIYANVDRQDVRVKSAFDWSATHWSLDQNPGMGAQGLYFFYHVLAKCMNAYGAEIIPAKDKATVNWRQDLARKMVSMQKVEAKTGTGYWENRDGAFWENNAILVTAYSLLTLEMLD